MDLIRTDLEWRYEPNDFFEESLQYSEPDFDLEINRHRASGGVGIGNLL